MGEPLELFSSRTVEGPHGKEKEERGTRCFVVLLSIRRDQSGKSLGDLCIEVFVWVNNFISIIEHISKQSWKILCNLHGHAGQPICITEKTFKIKITTTKTIVIVL